MLVQFSQKENNSPFDSIKLFDQEGNEYWSARDLMALLSYKVWQNMQKAIKRAMRSCQNQGLDVESNFIEVNKISATKGFQDFKLSRFACYLVAQNADPEKETVAMAQGYFAIKTREAEVIIPRQSEQLEMLRLQNQNLLLENSVAQSQLALLQFRHTVTTTMPEVLQQKILNFQIVEKVEYRDRILKDEDLLNDGSTINKTALCERYDIVTRNGKPDFKRLNDTLAKLPDDAFDDTTVIRTNKELKREYLSELDRIVLVEQSRQMYLGE